MRLLYNLYCRFVASFYMELRDFHNDYLKNPITATHYHLRMQKWESKIKSKGEE